MSLEFLYLEIGLVFFAITGFCLIYYLEKTTANVYDVS